MLVSKVEVVVNRITKEGFKMDTQKKQIVDKALDYMITVTQKQGRLLSRKDMFGDGSIFKGLTIDGFDAVYDSFAETLVEVSK